MHVRGESLVLERKSLQLGLGCGVVLLILGFVTIIIIEPESLLVASIPFGLLLMIVLGSLLHDASPKRNLVITPAGLLFSEGIYFYDQIEVKWDEINAVQFGALGQQTRNKTNIIRISKKGESKPYRINYSHLGGRHVQGHIALFTAKRAIELIENLRSMDSKEERLKKIKASKGMSTQRYRHNCAQIPFSDRVTLTCRVCEGMMIYDKQKPKEQNRCPCCGSEELSEA
jgi:hypothetical protein